MHYPSVSLRLTAPLTRGAYYPSGASRHLP